MSASPVRTTVPNSYRAVPTPHRCPRGAAKCDACLYRVAEFIADQIDYSLATAYEKQDHFYQEFSGLPRGQRLMELRALTAGFCKSKDIAEPNWGGMWDRIRSGIKAEPAPETRWHKVGRVSGDVLGFGCALLIALLFLALFFSPSGSLSYWVAAAHASMGGGR